MVLSEAVVHVRSRCSGVESQRERSILWGMAVVVEEARHAMLWDSWPMYVMVGDGLDPEDALRIRDLYLVERDRVERRLLHSV